MAIDKVITKFNDLPNMEKLKFGKQKSKDTPAMFIIAVPRDIKRQNGAEAKEVIHRDFFGDDAFKKGQEELVRLLKDKEVMVDSVIRYTPSEKQDD